MCGMSLTERSIQMDAVSLDQELTARQTAVSSSRRNHWRGGDVLEPEFENFLAALTRPARIPAGKMMPGKAHNSWQEVIDPS